MKQCSLKINPVMLVLTLQLISLSVSAQDGGAALDQANTMLRSYYEKAVPVMYAVGALCGIIGGVKVYQNLANGKHESPHLIASFLFACIFLVLFPTAIRAFFGI